MSQKPDHLFIGGPMDGRRQPVDLRLSRVETIKVPSPSFINRLAGGLRAPMADIQTVQYRRQILNIPGRPFPEYLMTLTGDLSLDDIMIYLLRGYRRVEN